MSETSRNAIRNRTGRIENRRVMGILQKTTGVLGELPDPCNCIEAYTVSVGHAKIERIAEREVYRHGKNFAKTGPRERHRHVETIMANRLQSPSGLSGHTLTNRTNPAKPNAP